MSMTSEMTRLAGAFEAAHAERLSAIAAMRVNVQHELERGRAERSRAMADFERHTEAELKEIFGSAAVLRGEAADLMDGFTREREKQADTLVGKLRVTASDIHDAVAAQIEHMGAVRSSLAKRNDAVRRAHFKALRRRVDVMLGETTKYIKALHKERMSAEHAWEMHVRAGQHHRAVAPRDDKPIAHMGKGETVAHMGKKKHK